MSAIADAAGLVILFVALFVVLYAVLWLLRAFWRGITTDWFGLHYEDKDSPYYHDKTGQGRGHH